MTNDFRVNIAPMCPKYNGKPKFEFQRTELGQQEGSYTIYTYGFDNNNLKKSESRLIFENNRMVTELFDFDLDGVADARSDWTYDNSGNMTSCEHDYNSDGKPDYIEKCLYDERGNVVQKLFDRQNDGIYEEQTLYTYNDADGLTDADYSYFFADGSIYGYNLIFDGNGNLLEKVMK